MSHMSSIGLVTGDQQHFLALIDRLVSSAVDDAPAVTPARHLRWTDTSGASLAVHLKGPVTISCVTPFFVAPHPARWRVRTTSATDDSGCPDCGGADCDVLDANGEMVTRATVQWLQFQPYRSWLGETREYALQVVAFAHRAAFYASASDFEADQASWWPGLDDKRAAAGATLKGFAAESFLPEGMFGVGGDVGARATCMFAGRVEAVSPLTNTITDAPFLHVRIATLPGAIDVVTDAPEGTPEVGRQAVVRAWLVGRPDLPPPPPRRSWLGRLFGRR